MLSSVAVVEFYAIMHFLMHLMQITFIARTIKYFASLFMSVCRDNQYLGGCFSDFQQSLRWLSFLYFMQQLCIKLFNILT